MLIKCNLKQWALVLLWCFPYVANANDQDKESKHYVIIQEMLRVSLTIDASLAELK
jgi:hypothetical protein